MLLWLRWRLWFGSSDLYECLQVALCLCSRLEVECPLRTLAYILLVAKEDFLRSRSCIALIFVDHLVVESVVQNLEILGVLPLLRL